MAATWTSRERNYALEAHPIPTQTVTDHPLIRKKAAVEVPKKTIIGLKVETVEMDDPLGADPLGEMDPLSAGLAGNQTMEEVLGAQAERVEVSTNNEWYDRVENILKEYSTSQHMKIRATFIGEGEQENRKVPVNTVKYRLEQLDDSEDGQQQNVMNMGQEECIRYLEQLNRDVANAWNGEERVKSLRLMTQTAKLLSDTNIPRVFYPSMFVLVTKILDHFGELVYERIRSRSVEEKPELAHEDLSHRGRFKASSIPTDAQETCRNWFYKVASTRELLPRVYVELSIIKAQRFIADDGIQQTLTRISQSIRGIGDPLAAAYARCYLARRVMDAAPTHLAPLWSSLTDMQCSLFRQVGTQRHESWRQQENLSVKQFMHLLKPATSYYLDTVGPKATREDFRRVLVNYAEQCNKSSFFLEQILTAFKPEHVATNLKPVMEFVRNVDLSDSEGIHKVFHALGTALAGHPPPQDKALPVLNEVWKVVTKIEDPASYMEVAEVFIEFVLKSFTQREADIFLQDVLAHVTYERAFEKLQAPLRRVAELVLVTYTDFSQIVSMTNFMPLLDLFVGPIRNDIAKTVLNAFVTMPGTTADPVVISTISGLAAVLHNSIDSLSFEDEQRKIAELINKFISKVDFNTDLEQHLTFLVDCRAAYPKLEPVKYNLIMAALNLANRTFRYIQGRHTKRTQAFVKACIAYTHITVPSLNDELLRMRLFILAGEVALQHQLLAQADTLFKATIMQIKDVEPTLRVDHRQVSTAPAMSDLIVKFCGVLVTVPGHPDPKNGPFHLLNGLLRTINEYPWNPPDAAFCLCRCYLALLPLLSALGQEVLPYHVERVESNDSLYALSEDYCSELHQLTNSVLENMLEALHKLKEDSFPAAQRKVPMVALELFNIITAHAVLDSSMCTLAARLFSMATKHPNVDKKFVSSSLEGLRQHPEAGRPDSLIPAMLQKLESK